MSRDLQDLVHDGVDGFFYFLIAQAIHIIEDYTGISEFFNRYRIFV